MINIDTGTISIYRYRDVGQNEEGRSCAREGDLFSCGRAEATGRTSGG